MRHLIIAFAAALALSGCATITDALLAPGYGTGYVTHDGLYRSVNVNGQNCTVSPSGYISTNPAMNSYDVDCH